MILSDLGKFQAIHRWILTVLIILVPIAVMLMPT